MDYNNQVDSVTRSVHKDLIALANGKPSRTISLRQTFPASTTTTSSNATHDTVAADLWDAVTNPARLTTWFAPVSGDVRINGHYSVTGHARGTVTECDAARRSYALSWEVGEAISAVRVSVEEDDDDDSCSNNNNNNNNKSASIHLSHTFPVDNHWNTYGPGAGGVGWDMTLLALALHMAGRPKLPEPRWRRSPEAAGFARRASESWYQAAVADAATADDHRAWAREAADRTTAFYVSDCPSSTQKQSESDKTKG